LKIFGNPTTIYEAPSGLKVAREKISLFFNGNTHSKQQMQIKNKIEVQEIKQTQKWYGTS